MTSMDAWDLALWGAAGYIALSVLVRMMQRRRDAILEDIAEQVEAEREFSRLQKKRERRKKIQHQAEQEQRQQPGRRSSKTEALP